MSVADSNQLTLTIACFEMESASSSVSAKSTKSSFTSSLKVFMIFSAKWLKNVRKEDKSSEKVFKHLKRI